MNSQKPMNEAMLVIHDRSRKLWRPIVTVCPIDNPDDMTPLAVGQWFTKQEEASRRGRKMVFDIYEKRYGFKHPEDPSRNLLDPLEANVLVTEDNKPTNFYSEGSNAVSRAW